MRDHCKEINASEIVSHYFQFWRFQMPGQLSKTDKPTFILEKEPYPFKTMMSFQRPLFMLTMNI